MSHRVFYSALSEIQIQRSFQVAQQGLLARRTFELSRFTYYLRVCCFVMQKVEWVSSDMNHHANSTMSYLDLIAALTAHHRTWWQYCYVNEAGFLQSDDPVLSQLLSPIEEFYNAVQSAIATSSYRPDTAPQPRSIELSV